ncbi:MAG: C1 family peptidase [Saprospiraceae bacterium]|nr:C1 family peptidase [Saprospiraceae bacterium]
MPIRFNPGENNNRRSSSRGDKDGKNTGAAIIMLILFGLFRKPKLTISLLLIAGIGLGVYFWMNPEQWARFAEENQLNFKADLGQGCELNQDKYDATSVFEPLASTSSNNKTPSRASLKQFAPRRRNQGQQGSCVGWASAYAARSILEAASTGKDPDRIAFSPSFLYNQIKVNNNCQGSYTSEALEKMRRDGLIALSEFPYNPNSCMKRPTNQQLREAQKHVIRGYNRLTQSGKNYDVDLNAIRQNIAQKAPVIIAMNVPPSFHHVRGKLWTPQYSERAKVRSFGGHAMCLIGYDDNYKGGAFEIMNSWGSNWGDDGICWIRYEDFQQFCREAYGLYPHPNSSAVASSKLAVQFGLINSKTGKNIPLIKNSRQTFKTLNPIKSGTDFNVEVTNTVECYTYIFGRETEEKNKESYVLFPYTAQHSPYCGIVGTRYFPKAPESLTADDIGDKDYMTIIVSKQELNYNMLNQKINSTQAPTYEERVLKALDELHLKNVSFTNQQNRVQFEGEAKDKGVVAVIFEFNKF